MLRRIIPCFPLFLIFTPCLFAENIKPTDRYFFSGDGAIALINAHTKQSVRIRYRLPDGTYPAEARQQIDRLFSVPVSSSDHISLRLVSVLDYIEDHYRQPIDIRMRKVLSAEWFQTLKAMSCCGVGYYHDNSLHVDTGPVRYWDETTSKVYTNISEHNKQIMVRTDQDIYLPGETVELRLARITDYPIGLASGFAIIQEGKEPKEFSFDNNDDACLPVQDPVQRMFKWTIPADFHPEGRAQLRLRLCDRAYPEMPELILSNPIEVRNRS
jgi:hypothetical protein